jgi:hypothetical protein
VGQIEKQSSIGGGLRGSIGIVSPRADNNNLQEVLESSELHDETFDKFLNNKR